MTDKTEAQVPIVASYWPILLLVGFASGFIPLVPMLGYRWSVELSIALLLLTATVFTFFYIGSRTRSASYAAELWLILLPLSLFIIWSFLSATWSSSWRGASHHSLLWACYFGFYLLVRNAIGKDETKGVMLKILAAVVFAISVACLVEYLAGGSPSRQVFNERYYSYAEIFVTVLPIFVACSLSDDRKWARFAMTISAVLWGAVLATTSRAMFIAGIVGLATFVVFGRVVHLRFENRKRWVVAFVSVAMVTVIFLVPFKAQDQATTVHRLLGNEEFSVKSAQSRILLWGLAVEGFERRPLIGIGAGNFFTDYKLLRESLSTSNPNDPILEMNEALIPERAHNEYLQILAELGIVGALLFGWLLAGIAYMFWLAYKKKASLLTIGALSGIVAFLFASGASSYSFRFAANGICFFFLLAIASHELFRSEAKAGTAPTRKFIPVLGVIISVSMIAFCLVRAKSIWHMTNAINAQDENVRTEEIESAIAIDPSEPMFRFNYGQWLQQSGRYDAAISQMRLAIDNGLADSTSFFRLAATELESGRAVDAEKTFVQALRVYPRSVFLRTAYAAFLKRKGDIAAADAEHGSALLINEKQARSWQLAHDEGLERLVQVARVDQHYVSPFDLKPESGPLALSNLQRVTK